MKNTSIFDMLISLAYGIGLIIFGFAISAGLFFIEGFLGRAVYQLYFGPISMKSVMGVVFLTSFMLGGVYAKLGKIITMLKSSEKKKNIPEKESKEERAIREYFDSKAELDKSIKELFKTITIQQFHFLLTLLFAWICHFFV